MSRSENRSAKLKIQNKMRNGFSDVTLVFSSVYKLFQFAALLSIEEDYPNFRAITDELPVLPKEANQQNEEETKNAVQTATRQAGDLKMVAITWNMGGSESELFGPQLPMLLPQIEESGDMVFFAAQECLQSRMTRRIQELDAYMKQKGFENID